MRLVKDIVRAALVFDPFVVIASLMMIVMGALVPTIMFCVPFGLSGNMILIILFSEVLIAGTAYEFHPRWVPAVTSVFRRTRAGLENWVEEDAEKKIRKLDKIDREILDLLEERRLIRNNLPTDHLHRTSHPPPR